MLLALEVATLAAVGFVVARVALRQTDDRLALAQGLVIGPALWGLTANFAMYLAPGMAGAAAAWGITLALTVWLARRARSPLRLQPRTVAGFAVAALALFWIFLAGRQLLSIVDASLHLGLAASIRAGGFPPVFPWHPGMPAPYHYGVDLLIGLLAPPFGPDLPFMTELLGAYIWTGFALVVATALLRRGGWTGLLVLTPLLLTTGAWTLVGFIIPTPDILQSPVPTGMPSVGFRTSLASLYWPEVSLQWQTEFEASPPNIWKPQFPLAYAVAFSVLERATTRERRGVTCHIVLATLLGFLGLVDEAIALTVLVLWALFEAERFVRGGPRHSRRDFAALRAGLGPSLAALLLIAGGGVVTGVLTGETFGGLSFGWIADGESHRPLGAFTQSAGGLGVIGLGTVPIVAIAALLAWRDRLGLALAVGSVPFLIAALSLQYEHAPQDTTRLDGHARNLALLALLAAASARLRPLRPRWRYAAAACIVGLIAWPTVATPVRTLGLALGHGIQFTNAQPGQREFDLSIMGRHRIGQQLPVPIDAYIRESTTVDSRILSPHPAAVTIATGRPNASGYTQFPHYNYVEGPEYLDAIRYLEPAAVRRLGYEYLHATDAWITRLPARATQWLNDPRLFELLIRDGAGALYRIRSAFLDLDVAPTPASFEALREAVPASASVYLSPSIEYLGSVRAASVLSHADLFGVVRTFLPHLRPNFRTKPLGHVTPDLVVTSARLAPSAFASDARRPIWWNEEIAVYAPADAIPPIMDPPPKHFSVMLSGVGIANGRVNFTANFTDRATELWRGQDWLIVAADGSPWAFPYEFDIRGHIRTGPRSYMGQLEPVPETRVHEYFYLYELDPQTGALALWNGSGYAGLSEPQPKLAPGTWVLAVRINK
ncbi:MAG: hypothetical protein OXI70_09750 [Chloroflexota bacterium]|nr:hypothetical protein [Chloroflexota bacterium]